MYTSRDIALIAAFAAVYTVWGFASSVALRAITLSTDLFFLIAVLFAILAVVGKTWSATLLGIIEGIIFLGTPAPNVWHITVSLIANGVVFDTYLWVSKPVQQISRRAHIVIAASLGNLVMAIVGLSAFQGVGTTFPPIIYASFVLLTTLAGTAGAVFGLIVAKRVKSSTVTVKLRTP